MNVFRIDHQKGVQHLHTMRHIDFSNVGALRLSGAGFSDFEIGKLVRLPKLKTVTIASDLIAGWQDTVRRRLEASKSTSKLVCIRVGVYQLAPAGTSNIKIYLRNNQVSRAYPTATRMAAGGTISSLINSMWEHRQAKTHSDPHCRIRSDRWTDLHLALWLICYEIWLTAQKGGHRHGLTAEEIGIVNDFRGNRFFSNTHVPLTSVLLPSDVELKDLDPALHGPELLEWASELLALNMQHFPG